MAHRMNKGLSWRTMSVSQIGCRRQEDYTLPGKGEAIKITGKQIHRNTFMQSQSG